MLKITEPIAARWSNFRSSRVSKLSEEFLIRLKVQGF